MEKIVLKSVKREAKEIVRDLRASKMVPAVVYGNKKEAISLKLGSSDVLKTYRIAGGNHIVELEVEGKKMNVLFHEVQKAPVSGDIIHVDFYAITKGQKVNTQIPLIFTGISKANSDEGAIIEELIKEIEVRCLPTDLIANFEVDLSKLEKIGDNIKISDLNISSKFEVLSLAEDIIVIASKPRVEVEVEVTDIEELSTEVKEEKEKAE